MNLEDHELVINRHMKLKLSPTIKLCWCFLLNKQLYQSEVVRVGEMDAPFANMVMFFLKAHA